MDSPYCPTDCKQEPNPGQCSGCGGPGSPKGTRIVAQILMGQDGVTYRDTDVHRLRVWCRNPLCPIGSWTIYEPGGYPHRRYALDVVTFAVGELAAPGATLTDVGLRLECDRTTVSRWMAWVANLGDVDELARGCARMDPDGLPPPSMPPPAPEANPARVPPRTAALFRLAGWVLLLLEHLAALHRRWGTPLEPGPGLVALLRRQLLASREVLWLARSSPPLRVDGGRPRA